MFFNANKNTTGHIYLTMNLNRQSEHLIAEFASELRSHFYNFPKRSLFFDIFRKQLLVLLDGLYTIWWF
ncbi:hypothetical protein BEH73_24970 [Citrobacter freundii]|nr:hypothetical protein BEH73_24970 [Citrobacter freundii]